MLHPALLTLMKLQFRGRLRATFRGARSPKRLVFLILAAVIFVLWISPALISAFLGPRTDPAILRSIFPLVLLGLIAISAIAHGSDKVVSFTPAEVNFLFPGPFTRRELLIFKIARSTLAAALSALFVSLFTVRYTTSWIACYVGMLLAMLFLQFASMAFVLTRQTAGEATSFTRGRRLAMWLVLVAAAVAVAPGATAALRADWRSVLASVQASPVTQVVLTPMTPIAMALTAPTWGQLAIWSLAAAAIDGALLLLVLKLDANLVGVALEASRRHDAVLSRMRRGTLIAPADGARAGRLRLPMPPRLGGAGPVLWRQISTALRASRGLLVVLGIFGPLIALLAVIGGTKGGVWAVMPAVIWVTLILGALLKLDFRGDLDRMEILKALPISGRALAIGQLATPTLMLALIHVVLLLAMLLFIPINPAGGGKKVLLWAIALAPPLDLLMIGVENLIFLLMPARPPAATPGDMSAMGRHAMIFLLKGLVMLLAGGMAAGAGAAAYFALGRSQLLAGAVTTVVLSAAAVATVPAVAWAFNCFDVSTDVPA